jgi:protein SCO1/2
MSRILFVFLVLLNSCGQQTDDQLPILGQHEYIEKKDDGQILRDTIYYRIPNFMLVDQDSIIIDRSSLEGKIYVADFFFTSCPTICPKMKRNMHDLYQSFSDESNLLFMSHSIDPKRDSVSKLKAYAKSLEVESKRWHFLTGEKDDIYELAKAYMVSAAEDPRAPGGYIHSGAFILIDQKGRIRGYYDGTLAEDTELLKNDIKKLLASIDS